MSNYLIEFAVCHVTLFVGYWVLLRKRSPYRHQRFFLLGAGIFSMIVPLLRFPKLFTRTIDPVIITPGPAISVDPVLVSPVAETSMNGMQLCIIIYAFISTLLLLRILIGFIRIISFRRRSKPQVFDSVPIQRLPGFTGSFSFLHWIFIGDDLEDRAEDYRAIVKHEEGHVTLAHTYDLLFLEILCCMFWWLPSIWLTLREIKTIHEFQADAFAISDFGSDRYSTILISSTLRSHGLSMISSFHDSSITKRLHEMKNNTKSNSISKTMTLVCLCATLICMLACTEENFAQEEPVSVTEVFKVVEEHPSYPGGMDAFYKYVMQEIRYPSQARKKGIEGIVQVQFVVDRDGSVTNVQTVKGIGEGCDEEVVRVVKNASNFNPGRQRGRTVRVRMTVPIEFKLQQGKSNPDGSTQGSVIIGEVQEVQSKLDFDAKYREGTWRGKVYDENGSPLPGASILLVGTDRGTVSDLDGTFKISDTNGELIKISFVGYESQEFTGSHSRN